MTDTRSLTSARRPDAARRSAHGRTNSDPYAGRSETDDRRTLPFGPLKP